MGVVDYAKEEFLALGYKPIDEDEEEGPNKWIQECVLELLEVFSNQGHSGSSAPFAIHYFQKLASFKPLSPITGNKDEWIEVSDDLFQNKRCSALFKKNGELYPCYLDAIVWKDKDGITFTGSVLKMDGSEISSHQFVKLPFVPKTFYIDIKGTDEGDHYIKDESQLDEVFEYYIKGE